MWCLCVGLFIHRLFSLLFSLECACVCDAPQRKYGYPDPFPTRSCALGANWWGVGFYFSSSLHAYKGGEDNNNNGAAVFLCDRGRETKLILAFLLFRLIFHSLIK